MALKIEPCLVKAGPAVPRDMRRKLIEETKRRAEEEGIHPTEAAKRVLSDMRDRSRADQASVMEAIKRAKAAPPPQAQAPEETVPKSAPTTETPRAPTAPPEQAEKHQAAQQAVENFRAATPNGPKVEVLNRGAAADDLTGRGQHEGALVTSMGKMGGYYDKANDRVVVIPENIRPRDGETLHEAVGRVITHEAAGHGGWTRMFEDGPMHDQFHGIMDAFWQHQAGQDFGADFKRTNGYGSLDELASWYGYDQTTPKGRASILEEHFARLAEDPAPPRWFDAVVGKFTELFRKFGFNAWTDSDTRLLLQKGRDAMGTDRKAAAEQAAGIVYSKNVADQRGDDPQKERKFIKNIMTSDQWTEKMQEHLDNTRYTPITEKQVQDDANSYINGNGLEETFKEVINNRTPTMLQQEQARQLIKRLSDQGRDTEAAAMASHLGEIATSTAQALRMYKPFADMSIASLRLYAEGLKAEGIQKNPAAGVVDIAGQEAPVELAELKKKYAERAIVRTATRREGGVAGKGDMVQKRIEDQFVKNPKSINRTAKQVMADLNIKMREVLMQEGAKKEEIRKQLTDEIVKRTGLSEDQAKDIAHAVHGEFDKQLTAAREEMLHQLMKDPPKRLPKSELEKLLIQNNSGQLDDSRFFNHLAKAHGIEVWTPELSAQIKVLQNEYQRAKAEEAQHRQNGNDLKDAGKGKEAQAHYDKAKAAQDMANAKGASMFDAIHSTIPKSLWAKTRALQNLSMLLNPKTIIRNIAGNTVLFAAQQAADAIAFPADMAVSLATGKRSRRSFDLVPQIKKLFGQPIADFVNGQEFARAGGADEWTSAKEGWKTMVKLAELSGQTVLEVNPATRHVFSHPMLSMLEHGLSATLSVPDRAFWAAAYEGSIQRQRKLRPRENFYDEPSRDEITSAMVDANRAIFQDPNVVSNVLGQIRRFLNKRSTGSTEFGVGSVTMPFTQVPGSMVVRGLEFSPLGFIKAAYEGLVRPRRSQEPFRQKEFVDAFSRAILGTGTAALGYWLAKIGVMTAVGEEDNDVRAMQEAAGFGKYRVNMSALQRALLSGNFWHNPLQHLETAPNDALYDYNWVQPNAMAVASGAEYFHQEKGENSNLPGEYLMSPRQECERSSTCLSCRA